MDRDSKKGLFSGIDACFGVIKLGRLMLLEK
jgi:hypothetical protein